MSKFLNYSVATDYKASKGEGRYVVQAEYMAGYKILARFKNLTDAKKAFAKISRRRPPRW